ncbi:acyl carrier protein [Streptomyces sp. NPDC088560]|uniref:acyl carrier protein n=1 Tax=Streptomyces sp. NPDC088560 TaxID=3365868 RepID=UPI0037F61032
MSVDGISDIASDGGPGGRQEVDVQEIWKDFLGADADLHASFIANGGDSLKAVLLADRLAALTGREIEYLDVLDAPDAAALARSLGPAAS